MSILKEMWTKEVTEPDVKLTINMWLSYKKDFKTLVSLQEKS